MIEYGCYSAYMYAKVYKFFLRLIVSKLKKERGMLDYASIIDGKIAPLS